MATGNLLVFFLIGSPACHYFAIYGISQIAKILYMAKGWQAAGRPPENRRAKCWSTIYQSRVGTSHKPLVALLVGVPQASVEPLSPNGSSPGLVAPAGAAPHGSAPLGGEVAVERSTV